MFIIKKENCHEKNLNTIDKFKKVTDCRKQAPVNEYFPN